MPYKWDIITDVPVVRDHGVMDDPNISIGEQIAYIPIDQSVEVVVSHVSVPTTGGTPTAGVRAGQILPDRTGTAKAPEAARIGTPARSAAGRLLRCAALYRAAMLGHQDLHDLVEAARADALPLGSAISAPCQSLGRHLDGRELLHVGRAFARSPRPAWARPLGKAHRQLPGPPGASRATATEMASPVARRSASPLALGSSAPSMPSGSADEGK